MSKSNPPSHMRLIAPLLRVMLVDDDPAVLRATRRALATKRPDWQITIQAGPAAALANLAREPIDVVVSDYEMPEMTGIDLFRRVKREYPTTLRVIASGKPKETAGVIPPGLLHAWLAKTSSAGELATTLEELLVRRDKTKRSGRTG
jgi:DNA-binding NarL/FixJ family response regulator